MRIDYDLIEKINDEIYDNDDYYNEEYYQVLCKKAKNLQQYISKYNITEDVKILEKKYREMIQDRI